MSSSSSSSSLPDLKWMLFNFRDEVNDLLTDASSQFDSLLKSLESMDISLQDFHLINKLSNCIIELEKSRNSLFILGLERSKILIGIENAKSFVEKLERTLKFNQNYLNVSKKNIDKMIADCKSSSSAINENLLNALVTAGSEYNQVETTVNTEKSRIDKLNANLPTDQNYLASQKDKIFSLYRTMVTQKELLKEVMIEADTLRQKRKVRFQESEDFLHAMQLMKESTMTGATTPSSSQEVISVTGPLSSKRRKNNT